MPPSVTTCAHSLLRTFVLINYAYPYCARNSRRHVMSRHALSARCWRNVKIYSASRHFTTIFTTTTRLFFSKNFWALCNTLPSIIPYMGSVWCYRNWTELEGIKMAPNYPVNLRWRVLYLLVRGFRVVDVARILHVWQIFVKKFRHFFRITEIPARWIILCGGW